MSTAVSYESRTLPPLEAPEYDSRRLSLRRREAYDASIPASIAEAVFDLPADVLTSADEATQALVRFDSEMTRFPAPFSGILLRTESASSSQIENLTSGPRAIAEAAIGERAEGNAALIISNVRAMEAAIRLADTISNASIIEIHDALLREAQPERVGAYRDEQVWIGGRLPHDAQFVAPHQERVPAAMDDLIAFIRRTDVPVLAQAAIAHAQFETIHPFPDGNGRTGRALLHALLRHAGVLRHLTVPVSAGLLTDIRSYFEALTAYRRGEPGAIVAAFADASFSALANAKHLADDLEALRRDGDTALSDIRADATARVLADLSLEYPALNSTIAVRLTGASRPAVTHALAQLADRGILAPGNSKRRNRIWVNQEALDALEAFAVRTGRRDGR
ncbi:Fic family protein [Leifsonia sp. McL0607]|uniref:Fic family protein n=1 Tax=Leifsonia sp. McL0607 TaxID=3415672 RepID=UPI003CF849EA